MSEVFLEPIVWIMRAGDNTKAPGEENQDYDIVATIIKVDDHTCKIAGLVSASSDGITSAKYRKLMALLKAEGFTKVIWDRKKKSLKKVTVDLENGSGSS